MNTNEIEALIQAKDYLKASEVLSKMNEADVTEVLRDYDSYMTLLLFRMLPKKMAAEVFSRLEPEQQLEIVEAVTHEELKDIMDELFFDDMVDLIEEMPSNVVKRILSMAGE